MNASEAYWLGLHLQGNRTGVAVAVLGKGELELCLTVHSRTHRVRIGRASEPREVYDAWNELNWTAFVVPKLREQAALMAVQEAPAPTKAEQLRPEDFGEEPTR